MSIGANLLMLRLKKSLSRQQLATLIGVSRAQIGLYETGKNDPGKDKLALLADVFSVSVSDLYSDELIKKLASVSKVEETDQRALMQKVIHLQDQLLRCREEIDALKSGKDGAPKSDVA